jgi:hypothetical protein
MGMHGKYNVIERKLVRKVHDLRARLKKIEKYWKGKNADIFKSHRKRISILLVGAEKELREYQDSKNFYIWTWRGKPAKRFRPRPRSVKLIE